MEKEGPTDVLAFPMDELRPGLVNEEPEEGVLGDLVLCPAVAERQGATAGHGTDAEIELLTVHGILHLLGYDHAEPEEHAEMFGLQDAAARRLATRGPTASDPTGGPRAAAGSLSPAVAGRPAPASFSAADAALSSFSRGPCRGARRRGPRRAPRRLVDAPRRPRAATSTPRCCCGCCARPAPSCWSRSSPALVRRHRSGRPSLDVGRDHARGARSSSSASAPRTLGRQQADRVAPTAAAILHRRRPGSSARSRSC